MKRHLEVDFMKMTDELSACISKNYAGGWVNRENFLERGGPKAYGVYDTKKRQQVAPITIGKNYMCAKVDCGESDLKLSMEIAMMFYRCTIYFTPDVRENIYNVLEKHGLLYDGREQWWSVLNPEDFDSNDFLLMRVGDNKVGRCRVTDVIGGKLNFKSASIITLHTYARLLKYTPHHEIRIHHDNLKRMVALGVDNPNETMRDIARRAAEVISGRRHEGTLREDPTEARVISYDITGNGSVNRLDYADGVVDMSPDTEVIKNRLRINLDAFYTTPSVDGVPTTYLREIAMLRKELMDVIGKYNQLQKDVDKMSGWMEQMQSKK